MAIVAEESPRSLEKEIDGRVLDRSRISALLVLCEREKQSR